MSHAAQTDIAADGPTLREPFSISTATAARATGLSESLIRKMIRAGELESLKVRRRRLIPLAAIKKLVGGSMALQT